MLNASDIKKDFPIFKQKIYGRSLVYLDSAATSQKPKSVIDTVNDFYKNSNANIHRGVYYLSEKATDQYEEARSRVAQFIRAQASEIIFTHGATESLNMAAYSVIRSFLKKGDGVLIFRGEHHSNILPWQRFAEDFGCFVEVVGQDKEGRIDMEELKKKLLIKNIKILSVAHVSNSSGVLHPIKEIIELAHEKDILVSVDACQSVPHMSVNVRYLDCDFLAFSAHKMLGPTGMGVLYGKKEHLEKMEPFLTGGGMISKVSLKKNDWADFPAKFEAGTPHIAGAIGLARAVAYLENLNMVLVHEHERELCEIALKALVQDPKIEVAGPKSMRDRVGIISFNIKGVHAHDIATVLDQEGVAIRAGQHCAQMMMRIWEVPATARVSFYLYNSKRDVERFLEAIEKVKFVFS